MNNEKYAELYDLAQCGEQEKFTKEFKKLTPDEHKEFLTQSIINYYECTLHCEVSKDNKVIKRIVQEVLLASEVVDDVIDWIVREVEEPDL